MTIQNVDDPSSSRPPASYWHADTAMIKLGGNIKVEATNVRSSGQNLYFTYREENYTVNFAQSMEKLFEDYYHGFVYCIDARTATTEL